MTSSEKCITVGGQRHLTVGSVAVMLIVLLHCETVALRDQRLTAGVLGDARGTPEEATTTTKGQHTVYSQHIICASRRKVRSGFTEHWLCLLAAFCVA